MKVVENNNKLYLSFEYNQEIINKCKSIGMRWSPQKRMWYIKDCFISRLLLNRLFGILDNPYLPMSTSYSIPEYLMEHQKKAVMTAFERPRFAFYFDTGTGKTLAALNIIKAFNVRTLVIAPIAPLYDAWEGGIKNFNMGISYYNLWEYFVKHKKDFDDSSQLYLMNYESFAKHADFISDLGIKMVILDESSKIKNPKAKVTKSIISFCSDVPYVYLLSGTPAPNSLMEFFPQMHVLDPALFGTSFYRFRDRYFYSIDRNGYKWSITSDNKDKLIRKISQYSVFVKKDDVLDLPERTNVMYSYNISNKEYDAYISMLKDLIVEVGEEEVSVNRAVAKIMKLRQVLSGFILGDKGKVYDIGTSKQDSLVELLDTIGNHQVIIWVQFKYEANVLSKILGSNCVICNSTVSTSQKLENIQRFQDGDVKYLVAHPKSVGMGTTFINSSYAVYYSMSYSFEEYDQSRDRIYRKGQKNACTYYHLMGNYNNKMLIDKLIYQALSNKKNMSDEVIRYVKSFTGGF